MITIYLAQKKDAPTIAKIHKAQINQGFLSSLDVSFLENIYLAIIASNASFCVIAKEQDVVVGFLSGTDDINQLYSYFLRNYFLDSLRLLFKKFFSISSIKKILETLWYPVKEKELPPAELLTMAVLRQFQGQGIAKKMLAKFLEEMKRRNVKTFKVLVGQELAPAISFYEKNGFILLKEMVLHGDNISKVYLYNV